MLPIYKPKGITSSKVTHTLRTLLHQSDVGHVGTLDPAAQGLMLILVGKATRLEQLLHLFPKTYMVVAEFGFETDTLDTEGNIVVRTDNTAFARSRIFSACQRQVGNITQIPPLFAAVKYRGRPLYYYARNNLAVPLAQLKRQVSVLSIRINAWQPPRLKLCVTCRKGVYIRSLVRDIAHSLGSCATVLDIVRTEAYGLSSRMAWSLAEISSANVGNCLLPITSLPLPRLQVSSEEQMRRLRHGDKLMYDNKWIVAGSAIMFGGSFLLTYNTDKVFGIGKFIKDDKLQMCRSLFTEKLYV
ncbi:MAG: tRNA pseudouridine(55) synthase TruB [Pseudomonadota bacterium]|nr:tRNA pseudouridine(55) synthase TruB [Pseudomonadota bacterium]